mgnify:FL=1
MAFVRVDVDGVNEAIAKLNLMVADIASMPDAYDDIGDRIVNVARSIAPFQTGALANSIKADNTGDSATITAGGPSRRKHGGGVYASIAHGGTYTHRSKGPRPFLTLATAASDEYMEDRVEREIQGIIRKLGLT